MGEPDKYWKLLEEREELKFKNNHLQKEINNLNKKINEYEKSPEINCLIRENTFLQNENKRLCEEIKHLKTSLSRSGNEPEGKLTLKPNFAPLQEGEVSIGIETSNNELKAMQEKENPPDKNMIDKYVETVEHVKTDREVQVAEEEIVEPTLAPQAVTFEDIKNVLQQHHEQILQAYESMFYKQDESTQIPQTKPVIKRQARNKKTHKETTAPEISKEDIKSSDIESDKPLLGRRRRAMKPVSYKEQEVEKVPASKKRRKKE